MLGPLFVPELLRLTRSPWTWALRGGYGAAALLAVAAVGLSPPTPAAAAVAAVFVPVGLFAATAVLAPLAAAGVGLPTRDPTAHDVLRAAVGDTALVAGLAAARAAAFGPAALAALPALVALDLPPETTPTALALHVAGVALLSVQFVRVGLGLAGWQDVALTSFGVLLGSTQVAVLAGGPAADAVLAVQTVVPLVAVAAAAFMVGSTARGLRRGPDPRPVSAPRRPRRLPPVADDALGWRERVRRPLFGGADSGEALTPVGLALTLAVAQHADLPALAAANAWLLAAAVAAVVGRRAAEVVAGDRETGALDVLLTVPDGRAAVLAAKARAVLRPALLLVPACGAVVTASLAARGGAWPAAGGQVVAALAAWSALAAAGGLWLSVALRTRAAATLVFGLAGAAVVAAGVAASAWAVPPPGWAGQPLAAAAVGLAVTGTAAWLLWRDAVRRFDRDPLRLG